ncbi:MAG: T9SS type A sorting domain-containing protein [Ignavibacteria bacterium]|jgi:hypothetical protein
MKTLLFITYLIVSSVQVYSQQASDYFPSQIGFEWNFKSVPLDSVNNPINSLAYFRKDSFASVATYEGKLANIVLTKSGPLQTISLQPYLDSLYYHVDGTNGFEYYNISGIKDFLLQLDSSGIAPSFNFVDFFTSLQDWYPVYQFALAVNSEYTLKQVDEVIFIDPLNVPVRFEYLGTRLPDEAKQTVLGNLNCKKFLLQWKVIAFFFTNLLTLNDTIWIAPGNWIVEEITPCQYVDNLTSFGVDPFTIPGLQTKLTDEIVSVQGDEIAPVSFTLKQNYPNPFNPTTKIRYEIPKRSFVTLKVCDILGKEVVTLVSEEKIQGNYEVNFDASSLTSGIYFYQLIAGFLIETKKMVLVK